MLAWAPACSLAPAGDEGFAEPLMLGHSIRSGPGSGAGSGSGSGSAFGSGSGNWVADWHGSRISCAMLGLAWHAWHAWSLLPGSLRNERPAALDPDRATGPQVS
jgi:hypothetical protein